MNILHVSVFFLDFCQHNDIVVLMIPAFDENGNLPPGVYSVTWDELTARYGISPHRNRLITGLRNAALALKAAGCARLYINGSFVTSKNFPDDFDACWDATGVKLGLLDPVLKVFDNGRAAQKAKYMGELFPSGSQADHAGTTFLNFFQADKNTGNAKGILLLDLRSVS